MYAVMFLTGLPHLDDDVALLQAGLRGRAAIETPPTRHALSVSA